MSDMWVFSKKESQTIENVRLPCKNSSSTQASTFVGMSECNWSAFIERARRAHKNRDSKSDTKRWASPKATSVFESVDAWAIRRLKPSAKKMGPSLTVAVLLEIEDTSTHPNVRLNPRWAECLMGLPFGWVQPASLHIYTHGFSK